MATPSLGFNWGSFGTSTYLHELRSNELGLDLRLSIFEEHGQDFAKICVQLVKRFGLSVGTGKAWDEADEETGFRGPLDDRGVCLHDREGNTYQVFRGEAVPQRVAASGSLAETLGPIPAMDAARLLDLRADSVS